MRTENAAGTMNCPRAVNLRGQIGAVIGYGAGGGLGAAGLVLRNATPTMALAFIIAGFGLCGATAVYNALQPCFFFPNSSSYGDLHTWSGLPQPPPDEESPLTAGGPASV